MKKGLSLICVCTAACVFSLPALSAAPADSATVGIPDPTEAGLPDTSGTWTLRKCMEYALEENISLKEACVALGFLTPERFDEVFKPEKMV